MYWALNKYFMSASSRRFDPAKMTIEEEVDRLVSENQRRFIKEQNPVILALRVLFSAPDIPGWMAWYDRKNRENIKPVVVLTENILPTVPYCPDRRRAADRAPTAKRASEIPDSPGDLPRA